MGDIQSDTHSGGQKDRHIYTVRETFRRTEGRHTIRHTFRRTDGRHTVRNTFRRTEGHTYIYSQRNIQADRWETYSETHIQADRREKHRYTPSDGQKDRHTYTVRETFRRTEGRHTDTHIQTDRRTEILNVCLCMYHFFPPECFSDRICMPALLSV